MARLAPFLQGQWGAVRRIENLPLWVCEAFVKSNTSKAALLQLKTYE
jgi:hypothetical protein